MRILITNDDGITAPGLAAAEIIAEELAGPSGEVWVIAPAFEQSAVSHAVSYVRPMRLEQHGERRYAVEGSPADCVLVAIGDVMKDNPPDLVLSGVNRGHNVAEDIVYSGTVAGAMEGALHKIRAIALSQYYGPGNKYLNVPFDAAIAHAPRICRALLDKATWHDNRYEVFYNVNFPACAADKVKGVRASFQGHRPLPSFTVDPYIAPNRRQYFWLKHGVRANEMTEEGSDSKLTVQDYATVTPLRADLTARSMIEPLTEALHGL